MYVGSVEGVRSMLRLRPSAYQIIESTAHVYKL